MNRITEVIQKAQAQNASDVHVVRGLPIRLRIDGKLRDFDERVLTGQDCEEIALSLCGDRYEGIRQRGELDYAFTVGDGIRCRMNVFRQQGSASIAIRLLRSGIPTIEELYLPPIVESFAEFQRGIVVITGAAGSGKSTTLAALLGRINHTRRQHIVTLEDPIEYIYAPDKCTINQREIGTDTESYASGLRAALRSDPDVILIGEMRTRETIATALTAAETGHLVFTTLHTSSAPDAIDRIVDVFPGEQQLQVRMQLSMTLRAVLSQQLLPRKGGPGRIVACEVMIPNNAIRSLIRDGKSPQIVNALATSAAEGNITMDNALIKMTHNGVISAETAILAAQDADYVKKSLGFMPDSVSRMVGK